MKDSLIILGLLAFVSAASTRRSLSRDREISRECSRLADRRSDVCGTFNECCRERCRRHGGRGSHICDYDDMYGERICRCKDVRGSSRDRNWDRDEYVDNDNDEYERGTGRRDRDRYTDRQRERSVSRECRAHVQHNTYSTRLRCSEFRSCCDRECNRLGTATCDRYDFVDATCHCD